MRGTLRFALVTIALALASLAPAVATAEPEPAAAASNESAAVLAPPAAPGEALPAAEPQPGSEIDAIVDGVARYYEGITHMRMDFRQVLRRKADPRTRRASGAIEFLKPGRMRWQYERPEQVLYVSDGTVLWSYQPEDALVYKARIEGSRLYHALRFLFGIGDLRESFEIALGPAHSPETAFLVLTPKGGHQDYKELSLVVNRATFEIQESFLVDPLDNTTHYIFDSRDYETPVLPERFEFTPPAGVTIQEI
jgi:outer membrane lipoprotein carrier protein